MRCRVASNTSKFGRALVARRLRMMHCASNPQTGADMLLILCSCPVRQSWRHRSNTILWSLSQSERQEVHFHAGPRGAVVGPVARGAVHVHARFGQSGARARPGRGWHEEERVQACRHPAEPRLRHGDDAATTARELPGLHVASRPVAWPRPRDAASHVASRFSTSRERPGPAQPREHCQESEPGCLPPYGRPVCLSRPDSRRASASCPPTCARP